MSPKWIMGFLMMFMIGSVIANVIDFAAPLGSITSEGTASYKLNLALESGFSVTGVLQFLGAVYSMLGWDYNFLKEGGWQILRWCLFFPISVALGFSILMWLFQSLAALGGGVLSVLRR